MERYAMRCADGCSRTVALADDVRPGDPFSRLSYRFGQLLGAADLTLEQQGHLLRHRLHQAAHHGVGTVWGLRVQSRTIRLDNAEDQGGMLVICPGLAVDAYGRDLYIPEPLCLDIRYLDRDPRFVARFRPGAARRGVYIAHVVIRFQSCLSDPAPAVAPVCATAEEAMAYTRIADGAHVELEPAPPEPHRLTRDWLARPEPQTPRPQRPLRDRLLAALLDEPGRDDLALHNQGCRQYALGEVWEHDTPAPVLLAEVQLERARGGDDAPLQVVRIDNSVRPLLPPLQLVAEQVFGVPLSQPDAGDRLQAKGWKALVDTDAGRSRLSVAFTQPLSPGSERRAVRLSRFTPGAGWAEEAAVVSLRAPGNSTLTLEMERVWAEGEVFQLELIGADRHPLLSEDFRPFAGWIDEPPPPAGQGRTSSLIAQWPSTPEE